MSNICPSILSEINRINEVVDKINQLDIKAIHMDVMDGLFVPNKTFDYNFIKSIKTNKLIDTHLMINNPFDVIDKYYEVSDIVTIHLEAVNRTEISHFLSQKGNKKLGISIKPKTNVEELIPYLDKIDLVLVMSVEPGFGGQKFMIETLEKLKFLKEYKNKHNLSYIIEVDGGINDETYKLAMDSGAEWLVVGTYLFKEGLENINNQIDKMIG